MAGEHTGPGLGMRLRKNDPTGNYWYYTDGVSPASDVLSDGYSSFTPGISEINGAGSRFYLGDVQGNSRGLLDGGQSVTDGYNWDAFGNSVSRFGSNPTAFAWNVSSGYQSDGDSGLKLLGHRYYDSRTGRFISQDPAGDGDNWYAYCGNDPTDATDPEGLSMQMPPTGETMAHDAMMGFLGGLSFGGSGMGGDGSFTKTDYTYTRTRSSQPGTGVIGPWGPWVETDEQSTTFNMGGGFMLPSGSMYQVPKRTWQEVLQGALQGLLVGVAIGHGGVTPEHLPKPVTIPRVTVKRAKADKIIEEEENDKGAGNKFSLEKRTRAALWAYKNFVDDFLYSVGRVTHRNSGYGVPVFSGAGAGLDYRTLFV